MQGLVDGGSLLPTIELKADVVAAVYKRLPNQAVSRMQRLAYAFRSLYHMVCGSRNYQFCFICLEEWYSFHEYIGCPTHGDPPEGYDSEGFELMSWGLNMLSYPNFKTKHPELTVST
jgi:hypothetical protein